MIILIVMFTLTSYISTDQNALERSAAAPVTFGRRPFIGAFTTGALDFVCVTLHAQFTDKVRQATELRLLRNVVVATRDALSCDNVIVSLLGSSCTLFSMIE